VFEWLINFLYGNSLVGFVPNWVLLLAVLLLALAFGASGGEK